MTHFPRSILKSLRLHRKRNIEAAIGIWSVTALTAVLFQLVVIRKAFRRPLGLEGSSQRLEGVSQVCWIEASLLPEFKASCLPMSRLLCLPVSR